MKAMFAKGPSSCGVGYLHPHAHALNPVQGSGQMELPGVLESHIQAAKQGLSSRVAALEERPVRRDCGSTEQALAGE